jgi:hypothetical protein
MSELPSSPAAAASLRELIDAQAGKLLSNDDLLVLMLPLFAQVAELHAQGRVAALGEDKLLVDRQGGLSCGIRRAKPRRWISMPSMHCNRTCRRACPS